MIYCLSSGLRLEEGSIIPKRSRLHCSNFANQLRLGIPTIRAFIAMDLDSKIKRSIQNIQEQLCQASCDINWVKPENVHLTLKFLGNIQEDKIPEIIQKLISLTGRFPPISSQLTHLGMFPDTTRPKVLWIGLTQEQTFQDLAAYIEQDLLSLGFLPENKKFHPHITIGRLKSTKGIQKLCLLTQDYSSFTSLKQTFDCLTFYKSILTSHGPVHEPLNKIKWIQK